nr:Glycine oxidase [Paraburkholderia busanensis]
MLFRWFCSTARIGDEVDFEPSCLTGRFSSQLQSGSLLIGASSDDVGYDTSIELVASANIANRALTIFPWLTDVRIVRMWSALRVMSPDGKPIYQELASAPGVYIATCHSGITLAPLHAGAVAEAIDRYAFESDLSPFSLERFHV